MGQFIPQRQISAGHGAARDNLCQAGHDLVARYLAFLGCRCFHSATRLRILTFTDKRDERLRFRLT